MTRRFAIFDPMNPFHHLRTHLTALGLALLLPVVAYAQAKPDLKALDRYFEAAVREFDQPGMAVGIVQDGRLIWSKGYGKLDLAKEAPVTPRSIFFAASISKAFTAAAIGLLVDEGRIGWDDPVRQHLPEFNTPDPYVTAAMTVRDLLCHRSGWATFDGDLLWYGTNYDQREILARHSREPFAHGFRERFGYSNLMYIAAAQLIERVSGRSWGDFVTERMLIPLGMTRTTVATADLERFDDVALPHVRKGQDPAAPQLSMPYQDLRGADGATGVNTCVEDLAKWDAMWANEGQVDGKPFLSRRSFNTLTSTQLAMGGRRDGAAMGWFVEQVEGHKVITHSGGMPGFILNHAVVPDSDLAVIALGNGESYCVFAATSKMLDLFLGDGTRDPATQMLAGMKASKAEDEKRRADRLDARRTGTVPTVPLEQLAGLYTDTVYGDAHIGMQSEVAHLTLLPAADLLSGPLEHWHFDTYRWMHADPFLEPGFVTFHFDADHRATHFSIDLHSPDFHFHKLELVRKRSLNGQ